MRPGGTAGAQNASAQQGLMRLGGTAGARNASAQG